jgi:hypothetical protein
VFTRVGSARLLVARETLCGSGQHLTALPAMPPKYSSRPLNAHIDPFDGEHGGSELPGLSFIRSESMEVRNDLRFFAGNVIMQRLGAFHVIAVSSLFIGSFSAKKMMELETDKQSDFERDSFKFRYAAIVAMAISFILCFTAAIIITVQLYHITRLATVGPTGFEMSKSYYLNANVTSMRHIAVKCFFLCIPAYMFAAGISIYVRLGGKAAIGRSAPLIIMLFSAAVVIIYAIRRLTATFLETYKKGASQMEPLLQHLEEFRGQNHNLQS